MLLVKDYVVIILDETDSDIQMNQRYHNEDKSGLLYDKEWQIIELLLIISQLFLRPIIEHECYLLSFPFYTTGMCYGIAQFLDIGVVSAHLFVFQDVIGGGFVSIFVIDIFVQFVNEISVTNGVIIELISDTLGLNNIQTQNIIIISCW